MSKDFKEFFPWLLFIAFLFAVIYGISKKNESDAKSQAQYEIESCMKIMHKRYKECKEIVYEPE